MKKMYYIHTSAQHITVCNLSFFCLYFLHSIAVVLLRDRTVNKPSAFDESFRQNSALCSLLSCDQPSLARLIGRESSVISLLQATPPATAGNYGNTGCGVFKRGLQNQKGFWLKINCIQMKLPNFENWSNGELSKSTKI